MTNSTSVAAGATGAVAVYCAPGYTVTGGGGRIGGSAADIIDTFPLENGGNTGWRVRGSNGSASTQTIDVWAICTTYNTVTGVGTLP